MKTYEVKFTFIVEAKSKEQAERKAIDEPSSYHQSTEIEEI